MRSLAVCTGRMEGMATFETAVGQALGKRDQRAGTLSARLLQAAGVGETGRDEDVSRLGAGLQVGLVKKQEATGTYRECMKVFRALRRRVNEAVYLRLCAVFGGCRFSGSRLFGLPVVPLSAIMLYLAGGRKAAKRLLQVERTPLHVLHTTLCVAKQLEAGTVECALVDGLRALCELLGDDGTGVKELFDCSPDVIELAVGGLVREVRTLHIRRAQYGDETVIDETDYLVFFLLCSFLPGSAFDNEVRRFAGLPARASPWKKVQIPKIRHVPPLHWVDVNHTGNAHWHQDKLTMQARPRTDWCIGPDGAANASNAPVLAFPFDRDCRLAARVRCDFAAPFDAGALFVYQGDSHFAKLCFQRAANGDAAIVAVVTKGLSDESTGPLVHSSHVHVQVSRSGPVIAFHYSTDEIQWRLLRLFCLVVEDTPTWVGFMAQAPHGEGCTVEFDRIQFCRGKQPNPRSFIEFKTRAIYEL